LSRYCQVIACAIAFGVCTVSTGLAQATRPAAVITGLVVDSSTAGPVVGAIAFIARNGIGSSTGADGRFVLPRVPPGEYDLVVSRVGYRRVVLRIAPGGSDTIALIVRLVPAPLEVGGVEVTAEAGNAPDGAPIFLPDGGKNSWCAYASETEVPVGILFTETALYFYHLDTAVIGSERYIRFWLLIFNGSEEPISFDADRDIRLDLDFEGRRYRSVKPDRELASAARNGKNPRLLSANLPVERTLNVMASQSQFFIDDAFRFDLVASSTGGYPPTPWLGWLNPPEQPAGVNPRHLMDVYDKCEHDGVLRRYTIAQGSGVDGTVWYPMPGFDRTGPGRVPGAGLPSMCEFTLTTPTGEERIVFSMH
jgi:hypothetical protein